MNKTEYSITRRGLGVTTPNVYNGGHILYVDDHYMTNDFQQLVNDAAEAVGKDEAVAVTITLSIESLGKSYEHGKRIVRSVDIDPAPEVI